VRVLLWNSILDRIEINQSKVEGLVQLLKQLDIPPEKEAVTHSFSCSANLNILANCYMAIVGICHQTSPIGEKQLEGFIGSERKHGWDYLKEKFLLHASEDNKWACFDFWKVLKPVELEELYEDKTLGKTLNRAKERTLLINDLGNVLLAEGFNNIKQAFEVCNRRIGGKSGFLEFLKKFEAYSDPVHKKSFFFLSIAMSDCKWEIEDKINLLSPVDYHELRGHLRVGTVRVQEKYLQTKLEQGIPFTDEEDTKLRIMVQEVNNILVKECRTSSSALHYLLWNLFRNCCPRQSSETHCDDFDNCDLPQQYKKLFQNRKSCPFKKECDSAVIKNKINEPLYVGHFY